MAQAPAEPFAVSPAGGLAVQNPVGGVTTFKAMAEATGGAVTALEAVAAPGEGPPLHVHRAQDEFIYTLEGGVRIRLGDEIHDAPPGAFVFIPRAVPHTWQNIGDATARFLAALTPAAPEFEQFFLRYAELPEAERGGAVFARLSSEMRAMEVVGPPLAQSHPA